MDLDELEADYERKQAAKKEAESNSASSRSGLGPAGSLATTDPERFETEYERWEEYMQLGTGATARHYFFD